MILGAGSRDMCWLAGRSEVERFPSSSRIHFFASPVWRCDTPGLAYVTKKQPLAALASEKN